MKPKCSYCIVNFPRIDRRGAQSASESSSIAVSKLRSQESACEMVSISSTKRRDDEAKDSKQNESSSRKRFFGDRSPSSNSSPLAPGSHKLSNFSSSADANSQSPQNHDSVMAPKVERKEESTIRGISCKFWEQVWAQAQNDEWYEARILQENMDGSYRVLFRDNIRVSRQPACLIARESEFTGQRRSTLDYDMKYQEEDDYDIVVESPEIALEIGAIKKWEIGSLCQVLDEDEAGPVDGSMWFVGRVSRIISSMGVNWLRVQWKDTFIWGPQHMMKYDYFKENSPLIKALEGDVCFKLLGRNTDHVQLSSPMLSTRYFQFQWLTTESKLRIPSFFFTPYSGRASFTLLFSHGNGCDLGIMRDLWYQLCNNLDVNIIGYDYYGYGVSVGDCTVRQTLHDIRTVWRYLTETLSIPSKEIILYGQSLGSGPTSYLARYLTDQKTPFGGIILHSGFLSPFRITEPCQSSFWFDIYQNIDDLQGICVPTLILHGQQDQIVPCSHGKILEETLKRHLTSKEDQQMIWLSIFPSAGHNDVEITCRKEYIEKILDFLKMCMERKNRERKSTYIL